MNKNRNRFLYSTVPSLIAILAGLVFGAILMLIVCLMDKNITLGGFWDGARLLIIGFLSKGRDELGNLMFGYNGTHLGNMLFKATPLIMTGLSVAAAFKAGLFNIGAPGQYLMGLTASIVIALAIPSASVPAGLILVLALLGGMVAGAVWGMIPGALKAYLNVNEVITCILTNWIAANLSTLIFEGSAFINNTEPGKSGFLYKTAANGVELPKALLDKVFPGSQVNSGIIIAVILAVIMYFVINKSICGFEMRLCGSNREAARYCGINENANIIMSMAIAGALAGIGAALYTLSGNTEFAWSTYQKLPQVGFNGIPVALLGCLNPIGVIFTGMFMSALEINGQQIANLTAYNEYITSIIIGVIVYLSAFTKYIRGVMMHRRKKGGTKK